jgi:hypothetical protein
MVGRKLLFEALEHGPHDVLAGLQDFMDVGVDFGFNIMVLPYVTVERNIHSIGSVKKVRRHYSLNLNPARGARLSVQRRTSVRRPIEFSLSLLARRALPVTNRHFPASP